MLKESLYEKTPKRSFFNPDFKNSWCKMDPTASSRVMVANSVNIINIANNSLFVGCLWKVDCSNSNAPTKLVLSTHAVLASIASPVIATHRQALKATMSGLSRHPHAFYHLTAICPIAGPSSGIQEKFYVSDLHAGPVLGHSCPAPLGVANATSASPVTLPSGPISI